MKSDMSHKKLCVPIGMGYSCLHPECCQDSALVTMLLTSLGIFKCLFRVFISFTISERIAAGNETSNCDLSKERGSDGAKPNLQNTWLNPCKNCYAIPSPRICCTAHTGTQSAQHDSLLCILYRCADFPYHKGCMLSTSHTSHPTLRLIKWLFTFHRTLHDLVLPADWNGPHCWRTLPEMQIGGRVVGNPTCVTQASALTLTLTLTFGTTAHLNHDMNQPVEEV